MSRIGIYTGRPSVVRGDRRTTPKGCVVSIPGAKHVVEFYNTASYSMPLNHKGSNRAGVV